MNILKNIARLLIAPVFIFAGFVKLIDPLGLTYKFNDYFVAFHIDFLNPLALGLAIVLSAAELLIGLNLLLKIRIRATSWALLIFMLFFTLLTFIIALTNPVTDCGCFGDALILTNWQTFFKNLIFLIPTLIVFYKRNSFVEVFPPNFQWLLSSTLFIINILVSINYYRNLPLIDFRPYKIGTHIPSSMEIPEGMPVDEYETLLVYEKNGTRREFTLESPEEPWNDSTWKWVETRNVLVKEGYKPPIHDFSLTSEDGFDITDQFLSDEGYSLLVIAHDLEKSSDKALNEIKDLTDRIVEFGYAIYGMTSSTDDVIASIIKPYNFSFEFYTSDDVTLKTMIRSNPGIMLIKDGVILGKWAGRNIPDDSFFQNPTVGKSLTLILEKRNNAISLTVILIISLLGIVTITFRLLLLN